MSYERVIRLASNVFSKGSHDNTVAHFVTDLKQPFDESGNWCVGVSEVSYTKSWLESIKQEEIIDVEVDHTDKWDIEGSERGWEEMEGPNQKRPRHALNTIREVGREQIVPVPTRVAVPPPATRAEVPPPATQNDAGGQTSDSSQESRAEALSCDAWDQLNRQRIPPRQQSSESESEDDDDANADDESEESDHEENKTSSGTANSGRLPSGAVLYQAPAPTQQQTPPTQQSLSNKPQDFENDVIHPVKLRALIVPAFPNVPENEIQLMYEALGRIVTYRGPDSGVYPLQEAFIDECYKVYGKEFPDQNRRIKPEAIKLVTEARKLRNIVLSSGRKDSYTPMRPNTFTYEIRSKVILSALPDHLDRVLKVNQIIGKIKQNVKAFIESTGSETDDAWLKSSGNQYDQLPLLSADLEAEPSRQPEAKTPTLDQFKHVVIPMRRQLHAGGAITADSKRTLGDSMYEYVNSNRSALYPLVHRVLYELSINYRSNMGRRRKRAAHPAPINVNARHAYHADDSATKIPAGVYSIELLLQKINFGLKQATNLMQCMLQNIPLYSEGEALDSFALARYRSPPYLVYDDENEKVNVVPGTVVLFDDMSSFHKTKEAAKLYPKFSNTLCSMLGLWPRTEGAGIKETVSTTRSSYYSLLLYSNIVRHTPVGDTLAQLLRLVEIPGRSKFGQQITITYDKPQFYPLNFNYFKSIEIKFLDDTGRIIPFQFGRTYVTLVLKKLED